MWVSGLRYDGVFLVLCDFSLTPVEDPVWSEKKAKSLRTAPDPSIEAKRYKKKMRKLKYIYKFNLFFLFAFFFVSSAMTANHKKELPILQSWRGDYPVSEFHWLPDGQRAKGRGYIGNMFQFKAVWYVFKPGETLPDINFQDHIVVFSRNVTFYNRMGIVKALLRDGVVEVLTIETRSALPIEGKVAMALAVIPREGVKFIKVGDGRIPVAANEKGLATDPFNATYIIEGNEIPLQNGRFEAAVAPDSAMKIRTSFSGDSVTGDLDGDGDEDTALILVHDPGGSGTFYYVAVSENWNGHHRGTNGVMLGDRIVPKDLKIRNGVVIVKYARRGLHEPMSMAPSVEGLLSLAIDGGKLKALKPLGTDEQILEGRVIIGHEVRSFHPCTRKTDYWLSGDSSTLKEIIARYKKALPDARPYTMLFMVLSGKFMEAPQKGYGADYLGAFFATQVVGVRPDGNCKSKLKLNQ